MMAGGDRRLRSGRRPDFELVRRFPTAFRICLSHQPRTWHEVAAAGAHLMLAGHTHGGQVRFGNWQPIDHSEFGLNCGSFRHGDAHLFVGKGAGVTVAPLRVGAAPEISLVHWG